VSGVKAVRHLLISDAALVSMVPVTRIVAGTLPAKTQMPALAVTHVGAGSLAEVSGQGRYRRARVQVTVCTKTYPELEQLLQAVRSAIPRRPGAVAGIRVDSILRDQEGADLSDDDVGICARSQDFIVAYIE